MRPQISNRTIFTGDNLEILRGFNSDSVDLVYLDPPFNSNRNYAAPVGSEAAGAAFKDVWTLDDTDEVWLGQIADSHPGLYSVIHAMGAVGRRGDKAYLIYMAVRLLEIHRVMKDTASIYLHCDPTMSHPLKMTLDSIFGVKNFRNEIIWYYTGGGASAKKFSRKHDTLLFYTKSDAYTFNDSEIRIPYTEGGGTATALERKETMLKNMGDGGVHEWKPHPKGKIPEDHWHIPFLNPMAKERTGYPTQKPLALLRRIIEASSSRGEMVLDPFCGCATTCVAAEGLGRQWIGIDISRKAVDLVKQRLHNDLNYPALFAKKVTARNDIPRRTDAGVVKPAKDIKHVLFGRQQGLCNGCKHDFPFRNFTVDHILPLSRGGQDNEENLQLLCNYCNSRKGAGTMEELLAKLKKELMLP